MKYIVLLTALLLVACENDSHTTEKQLKATEVVMAKKSEQKDEETSTNYKAEIVPEKMTVQEKKERFRQLILPPVKRVFADLQKQYKEVKAVIRTGKKLARIERLKKEYKASSDEDLLARLKPHPVSIVLAQAAMDSAWATSRFFVQAKNIFGVWSFNKNEPRIAAGEKRGKKTIWLKKYETIEDAVRDNYRVLARGAAFEKFRQLRLKSENPFELVKGLDKYSEIGAKYGKELAAVISFNKFNKYD